MRATPAQHAAQSDADAFRFLIKSNRDGVVEVAWSSERNHHPVAVGTLTVDCAVTAHRRKDRWNARRAPAPRHIFARIASRNGAVMEGRRVSESASEYSELALPNDANGLGNLLGGKIMHLVDLAGAIAAMKHCRNVVVTASIDHMDFIHPGQDRAVGAAALQRESRVSHLDGSRRQGLGGGSDSRRPAARFVGVS